MVKRKIKDEVIYNRVRTKDIVYIIDRHNYILPPTIKRVKITSKKSYVNYNVNYGSCIKDFYLYYGNKIKINLLRKEVYTSRKRAQHAFISAYRMHIKKRTEYLNKIKKMANKLARELPAKKANLKRLEKKYNVC